MKLFIIRLILLMFFGTNAMAIDTCSDIDVKFSYKTKNRSVIFTNRSVGDYSQIIWKFSDGTTSSEPNPTHTFAKVGLHHFSLTIVSANGCSETFEGKVYLF